MAADSAGMAPMPTAPSTTADADPDVVALQVARDTLAHEQAALAALAGRLDGHFTDVVDVIAGLHGRVVVTGLGKSGLVGRKIAATLASTGTPASFLHAAEALHGDSGSIMDGDLLLALSASGETDEVCLVADFARRLPVPVVAMTGNPSSRLAGLCPYWLDVAVAREADPLALAPTASTTVAMALGDALAAALMMRRGFTVEDFARFHPGGTLGRLLRTRT